MAAKETGLLPVPIKKKKEQSPAVAGFKALLLGNTPVSPAVRQPQAPTLREPVVKEKPKTGIGIQKPAVGGAEPRTIKPPTLSMNKFDDCRPFTPADPAAIIDHSFEPQDPTAGLEDEFSPGVLSRFD